MRACFNRRVKSRSDLSRIVGNSVYLSERVLFSQVNAWMNFRENIPLNYLMAIGASEDVIIEKLQVDTAEFERYKNSSLYGAHGVIQVDNYASYEVCIPRSYTEQECVIYIREKLVNPDQPGVVHFGEVKSIWVDGHDSAITVFYTPDLSLGKDALLVNGSRGGVYYHDGRNVDVAAFLK